MKYLKYETGDNRIAALPVDKAKAYPLSDIFSLLEDGIGTTEIILFHDILDYCSLKEIKPDKDFETHLLLACCNGETAHVNALLEFGVDPACKNADGETPISSAAAWSHDGIVISLAYQGAAKEIRFGEEFEASTVIANCNPNTILDYLGELGDEVKILAETDFIQAVLHFDRIDILKRLFQTYGAELPSKTLAELEAEIGSKGP